MAAPSSFTGRLVYAKICVLTAVKTLPFIAFVTTLTDLGSVEPCVDGCIFIRPLGSTYLPSTRMPFLGNASSSELSHIQWPLCFRNCTNDTWEFFPRFVLVRNGEEFQTSAVVDRWFTAPLEFPFGAYFFLGPGAAVTGTSVYMYVKCLIFDSGQTRFPAALCGNHSKVAHDGASHHDAVNAEDMTQHLNRSYFRMPYAACAVLWAATQILHDALLHGTSGKREALTIRIGLLSHFFQTIACLLAFCWSVSVLGVLMLHHDDPADPCDAYYQLPMLEALLAMSVPCLLFYTTFSQQCALGRSIQFGDYLYSMQYDLPYRFVAASPANDPADTMVSLGLRAEDGEDAATSQGLTFAEMEKLKRIYFSLCRWWLAIAILIGGFAVPPLFIRLLELGTRTCGAWLAMFRGAIVGLVLLGVGVHHCPTWGHLDGDDPCEHMANRCPTWGRLRRDAGYFCKHVYIPVPCNKRGAMDFGLTVCLWSVPFAVFPCLFGDGPLPRQDGAINWVWRLAYSAAFLYISYGEAYIDLTLRPIKASLRVRLLEFGCSRGDQRLEGWKYMCRGLPPSYGLEPYAFLADAGCTGTVARLERLLAEMRRYLSRRTGVPHGEAAKELLAKMREHRSARMADSAHDEEAAESMLAFVESLNLETPDSPSDGEEPITCTESSSDSASS